MDLQITAQTSKWFDSVKVIHLEPTDVCQAACPLCARETDINFDKSLHHHLSIDDIKRIVPESVIANLDKMFMCGNYGDPAANKNSIEIYRYFRSINCSVVLGMNTNGGLQNTQWWAELASVLNQPNDYVVFSVDGLKDTNAAYRKNVNWNKLMENAAAFIKAGGSAHWDMLVYSHNEHQVDLAQQFAKDMGFSWFRAKVSKRESNISWLNPPRKWQSPIIEEGQIECFRDKEKSIYISAQGTVYPCCWLGQDRAYTIDNFNSIRATWNTDTCNAICKKVCSKKNEKTSFTNQWQRGVAF